MSQTLRLSNAKQARITEVFSSLQGEGIFLGERQIFVRFGGCNLRCDYCDEPDTIPIPSGALWSNGKLRNEIERLSGEYRHKAVSWTGGEPLLHADFLISMMRWAKARGLRNYLETNGTLVAAFRKVANLCDTVAMDIKLPSAIGRATWSEHLEFLRVAPKKTFVKVVLTSKSTRAEWRQIIRLMQEVSPGVPLILQPATAYAGIEPIEPREAIFFLRQAKVFFKDVRLIPQWHPVWKLP